MRSGGQGDRDGEGLTARRGIEIVGLADSPLSELPYLAAAPRGGSEPRTLSVTAAYARGLPEDIDAIIATSDLQGTTPSEWDDGAAALLGEVLPRELVALAERGLIPSPERTGVVLAGDLFSSPAADKRGASGDVRAVWEAFAAEFRWVAGVAGNHDEFGSAREKARFKSAPGVHLLDDEVVELDGVRIAGLWGIIGPTSKPGRRDADAYSTALRTMLVTEPDLLVVHEGPDVPELRLRGSADVSATLSALAPCLVIGGHNHWDRPRAVHASGSEVLNVDGRVVVIVRA